jgi:protein O-GlcNAc transferase
MDYHKAIEKLYSIYLDLQREEVDTDIDEFQDLLAQIPDKISLEVLQFLNFSISCLEPDEVYCQVGCFQGGSLIGALLNNPDVMAYAVDYFSTEELDGNPVSILFGNLAKYQLQEQVFFCNQNFEEFFIDLQDLSSEDKIGFYFYQASSDYRSQFLGLLLVRSFLADRALIVISNVVFLITKQAVIDFISVSPEAELLVDIQAINSSQDEVAIPLIAISWERHRKKKIEWDFLNEKRQFFAINAIQNLESLEHKHFLESTYEEAIDLQRKHEFHEAERKYKYILLWDSQRFEVLLNLGMLYYQLNNYFLAINFLSEAVKIDSSKAIVYYNLGLVLEELNRIQEAKSAYQMAIKLDSKDIDSLNNLGNIYFQNSEFKEAELFYRRAVSVNSLHFGSYLNLGNSILAQNRIDEAIENYRIALSLEANNSKIINNIELALQGKDGSESISLELGHILFCLGRYREAILQYDKYLPSTAKDINFYFNFSESWRRLMRPDKAVDLLRQGIECYPRSARLHIMLIRNLRDCGYINEALSQSELSLKILPDSLPLQITHSLLLPILYQNREEIDLYRQRFIRGLQQINSYELQDYRDPFLLNLDGLELQTNFYLHYQGFNDVNLQIQYGNILYKVISTKYPQWSNKLSMPSLIKGGKIRVGYISTCMYNHVVGRLFKGWLKHSDRTDFEIYCYSMSQKQDSITQEFKLYSDTFHQLPSDLEVICHRIMTDQPHILVFLDLEMVPIMMQIASLRLAPVQCKAWGPPITSGLPTIDYFLSSELMEAECSELHYSEQLIRLPNLGFSFTKPIIPEVSKTRLDFQIPYSAVVYFSAQSLFKYLPQYDYIFVEIAKQVPKSRFIFLSSPVGIEITEQFQQRLQHAFVNQGMEFEKYCTILPRLSQQDYWNLMQLSDIFLDTFSWSGGMTTLEAISCNIPVVTCPGTFLRGRHAYGILRMLGVIDTTAHNEAEYVDIAVRLGLDVNWRYQISNRIRERQDFLYDDQICVKGLEEFYKQVILNY